MFDSTYRLLKFFDSVHMVSGRKKLQKMIHLLECSGEDLSYQYEYHYYGPYSDQLQEEVNVLVQQGFLDESHVDGTYIYQITEKGKHFKDILENNGNFSFTLNENLVHMLSQESSQFLEMVSTFAYLIESGYSHEDARIKAQELKPHLGGYLDRAISYYFQYIAK